jgi:hypothetical protein
MCPNQCQVTNPLCITVRCTWRDNLPVSNFNFSFSLAEEVGWCCISSARWLSPTERDLRASGSALQVGRSCSLSHLVSMALKQRSEFPALACSMESRESGLISSSSPMLYHCVRASHMVSWTLRKSLRPRQPKVQEWAFHSYSSEHCHAMCKHTVAVRMCINFVWNHHS